MRILDSTDFLLKLLKIENHSISSQPITDVQIDSRLVKSGTLFFGLQGNNVNGSDYAQDAINRGASYVISNNLDKSLDEKYHLFHESPIELLQFVAKALAKNFNGTKLGITGSNGKTTVKNLLSELIEDAYSSSGNLNNEIGLPLSILDLPVNANVGIFEMGAGQPGDIKFLSEILSPSIGIITSIGRSHLERLGSEEGVLRVKSELIENIQSGGTAIIPHGKYEEYWKSIRSDIDFITFGFDKDADFQAKIISQTHQNCSFEIKDNLNQLQQKLLSPLLGTHNVLNVLIAFIASQILGQEHTFFKTKLKKFKNFENRLSPRSWINKSIIINDSYNANPESFSAGVDSLNLFEGRKIIVLGDMLELGNDSKLFHEEVGQYALNAGIESLFSFGNHSKYASMVFGKNGKHFDDENELKLFIKNNISSGDLVYIKGSRGMKMERFIDD